MADKMIYPCTFTKKVDDEGDTFWRGEQKQLDILVDEYSFADCVAELERTMKSVFRRMTGSDAMDHLIRCQQIAVKGVVSFKTPVNRTLTEFMQASAENVASDEGTDLPDVNEVNMAVLATIISINEVPEDWVPKNGDPVVYRKPAFAEECGVFVITDDNDPEDWDGEVFIGPIDNETDVVLESLEDLAPCPIGKEHMALCKELRNCRIEKLLSSIPTAAEDKGGVADEQ